MRRALKVYEKTVWFITILGLTAAAVLTLPKLVGIQPYIILSASMEPVIPTGSLVFVNTRDKQVSDGDIIAFTMLNGSDSITVTHRIVETAEEGFVTKGDNNAVQDLRLLTSDRIVGKYVTGIPYAGYLLARLTKKIILVAAAWLFGLHMAGSLFDAVFCSSEDTAQHARDPRGI